MKIRIKVFVVLKDVLERAEFELDLPLQASCSDAISRLRDQFGFLGPALRHCSVAINGAPAAGDALLVEGDELTLLPPMASAQGVKDPRPRLPQT